MIFSPNISISLFINLLYVNNWEPKSLLSKAVEQDSDDDLDETRGQRISNYDKTHGFGVRVQKSKCKHNNVIVEIESNRDHYKAKV